MSLQKYRWRFTLSGKFFAILISVLIMGAGAHAEIIKTSLLKKDAEDFVIKRDLFNPGGAMMDNTAPRGQEPVPEENERPVEEEKRDDGPAEIDVAAEVRRSIIYEGFVIKNAQNHALLSINGEFFIAAVDDIVLDKVKIVKIEKKEITVEVETKTVIINLKEDNTNEIQ